MSKGRKVSDVERTATMLDLVHAMYPSPFPDDRVMSRPYVVIEECAPGTGWSHANRYADVLALSVWPSNGLTLDGYEIKASRADLKKELSDLRKHEAVARYCDTWTLVVWDESVLVDGIPETWGIITTRDGDHGRELVTTRKATKRTPEPWPRGFVCALVRNASEQSPGAAYVARACSQSRELGVRDGKHLAESQLHAALAPLAAALYGSRSWNWPSEAHDPEKLVSAAVARLAQGVLPVIGA